MRSEALSTCSLCPCLICNGSHVNAQFLGITGTIKTEKRAILCVRMTFGIVQSEYLLANGAMCTVKAKAVAEDAAPVSAACVFRFRHEWREVPWTKGLLGSLDLLFTPPLPFFWRGLTGHRSGFCGVVGRTYSALPML